MCSPLESIPTGWRRPQEACKQVPDLRMGLCQCGHIPILCCSACGARANAGEQPHMLLSELRLHLPGLAQRRFVCPTLTQVHIFTHAQQRSIHWLKEDYLANCHSKQLVGQAAV